MLYADDAGVVSQSPEQLKKMMGMIMVVCAAFGLTVSEAETEIMCLRAKGMLESTATFNVEAAGQVYNQTNEFVYLGGNVNQNADLSIEVDRRVRNAWCSFRKYTLKLYDRPSAPLELKIRMLRTDVLKAMLYGCVAWNPRACHYDTLRRAHHGFLTRCIGWRKHNRADHPISYLDTLLKTGSESIEATLRRRRILFAGFVARMEDTRLPKCMMFVLFCFVFVSMLSLKSRPFVQSSFDMQASRQPHVFLSFSFFLFVYLEMSLFPSILFCTISAFSLYGEYVVRSFLLGGVFSTL